MRLWKLIIRHMAAKVFLAIGLGIGVVLVIQAYVDSHREARILKGETRKWAENIAELFIGAVEHSMRQGSGIDVKSTIGALKSRVDDSAQVRIYDQRGIEVFAHAPPPPAREDLGPDLAAVLTAPSRRVGQQGRVFRPILAEQRCQKCHEDNGSLRGVLELDINAPKFLSRREQELSRIIAAGFTAIMTAEREDLLDDYFDELTRETTSVEEVSVFDTDIDVSYGKGIEWIEPPMLEGLFAIGSEPRYTQRADGLLALMPLAMQDRCVACHNEASGVVRGVLAMSFRGAHITEDHASRELEGVIETSLRYIMLSNLGRRIADFLDEVATTGAVDEVALYDQIGRRYWTTSHPQPPAHVARVLRTKRPDYRLIGNGMKERMLAIYPLLNSQDCVRCHGSSSDVRGAVTVSVSTTIAIETQQKSMRLRMWFTAGTLLGILLLLSLLVRYLISRPVKQIGDVADEIGDGNLGVTVTRADPDGDEIARLGQQINEMVRGLRIKVNLEKFVSKGAAEAAAVAGLRAISRMGERRSVTVLFSDIRGFTAYSECVAPETVVEMLNRLLRAQAEVVVKHGGDIDKYVGDELMAVFIGDDSEAKAVQCAVAMLDAVRDARKQDENLAIGVGISSGDVVYGAIGHEERMDFTVIGDVVNTGARLCSAASPSEILISAQVRDAAGEIDGLRIAQGEPLRLKGKREPFPVYRVERIEEEP